MDWADNDFALAEHPAVLAWSKVQPLEDAVSGINRITSKEKAIVWRMYLPGRARTAVIAKLSRTPSASTEREIYEYYLPHLSIDAPAFYGSREDETGGWWLFMQDAGEAPYEYADPEHQRLAARWLARLHVGGSRIAEARSLPDRGPDHFLGRLRLAVDTLKARRETASANADLEILDGLLTQCEVLALNWGEIEAFCSQLPRTIVHGDFAALNARVRSEGDEKTLLCFDWEKAGYGVPVVDMARGLDLEAYYSEVHHGWPALSLDDVRRMALVGRVFRPLSHNWARKTPVKLHDHYVHMQETLHKFGWEPREVRP